MPKKDAAELYCLDADALREALEYPKVRFCRLEPLTPPRAIWVRGTFALEKEINHEMDEKRSAA